MLSHSCTSAVLTVSAEFFLLHFFNRFVCQREHEILYNINYNFKLLVCSLCSVQKKQTSNWHLGRFSAFKKIKAAEDIDVSEQGQFVINIVTFLVAQLHVTQSLVLTKRGVQITHTVPQEGFEKSKVEVISLEAPNARWTMARNRKQNNRAIKSQHCCALIWWLHSYQRLQCCYKKPYWWTHLFSYFPFSRTDMIFALPVSWRASLI